VSMSLLGGYRACRGRCGRAMRRGRRGLGSIGRRSRRDWGGGDRTGQDAAGPADRVKTDRKDAELLARLLMAGSLRAAVGGRRELTRLHDACRRDLITARHRASKMLLRHGRGGSGHEHRDRRLYEEDHGDDRHAPDQAVVAAVPSAPDAVLAVWLAFGASQSSPAVLDHNSCLRPHVLFASRRCSRSWATSSISLWRHSAARY
jgi:hypothetical protein